MALNSGGSSRLLVLMFTDLVGSVELKNRLGANAYTSLIARHDRLFREIVGAGTDNRVIQDTGDGFLAGFATTSDAVQAALRFQDQLRRTDWGGESLQVRIGLNVGQVNEVRASDGSVKLIGMATDIAARVMGLALGGQILMTRAVFDDARLYVREHGVTEGQESRSLRWMAHGPYLFKGADEPVEVFEVGIESVAPLRAPPDSEKARRSVALQDVETLGWRPATGLDVPRRAGWVLQEKLGVGGFGEVWLGKHRKTKDYRVFKFCFDADRLRSFKRELTLFRLLREALGDRADIARLHEVQLEEPPYFLESEYSAEGSLSDWSDRQGGLDGVPMATRLDIVARSAEALAAAHSVGVLHKDIKPSNIFVFSGEDGGPRPRLADFGIGMLTDRSRIEGFNITITGLTEDMLATNESSRTGTRMYAPPESLTDAPFTMQGDIYALGVLLYQMIVGDLTRPLAQGWQADVADPLLVEDIEACVAGDLSRRLTSAAELARRLRSLDQRRTERRRRRLRKLAGVGALAGAVIAVVAGVWAVRERGLRFRAEAAERAEAAARERSDKLATGIRSTATDFIFEYDALIEPLEGSTPARLVLVNAARSFLDRVVALDPDNADLQRDVGAGYLRLGDVLGGMRTGNVGEGERAEEAYRRSLVHVERALALSGAAPTGPRHQAVAAAQLRLGDSASRSGRVEDALARYTAAVESAEKSMAAAWPTPESQRQGKRTLMAALDKVADAHRDAGRVDEAAPFHKRSMTIRREMVAESPDDAAALRSLTVGLGSEVEVLQARGDIDSAIAVSREIVGIRERLVEVDAENSARHRRDLVNAQVQLGGLLRGRDPREAEAVARRAVSISEDLMRADPTNARYPVNWSQAMMLLADILSTQGRDAESLQAAQGCIARLGPVVEANPSDRAARSILAMSQRKAAEVLLKRDQHEQARALLDAEVANWEAILAANPNDARAKAWIQSARRELSELAGR